jgi:hypothetical protein
MHPPSVLRVVSLALAGSVFALAAASGCSLQGEGERCDFKANSNADCNDGLVCTEARTLQNGADKTDRCCPPGGGTGRCAVGPMIGTGGATGTGGSSGAGAGGGGNGGSAGAAGGASGGADAGAAGAEAAGAAGS